MKDSKAKDDPDVETPTRGDDGNDAVGNDIAPKQDPTLFSDERGNLKFVNLVVRRPCTIFWAILVLCLLLTFLLNAIVFANAENGNPFSEPENEFDLDDIRSIQYDSLRLARDIVQDSRDAELRATAAAVPKQSEVADLTYWVYQAETSEGVFGSKETIQKMKDSLDIFLDDQGFEEWCLLDYRAPLPQNASDSDRKCSVPTTSLSMYYASEWDTEKVDSIINQLKDPERLQLFNNLALCYTLGQYCELVPNSTAPQDIVWAVSLGENVTSVVQHWDMKGDLVANITQATELASYLMLVDVFKKFVDFGFDKGFSVDNQVSMHSRGIVYWGGPLDTQDATLTAEGQEAQEDSESDRRKDYILDNYLEEMDEQANENTHGTINSYYFMAVLVGDVILNIVVKDALLALFSLGFVFIWLRINTGSWFLATVGFLEISLAIPVSWFLFSAVFQIKYFATLNALAIFIVAAIGADDIFIFMDAYKMSKQRYPENLVDMETRMSWVYRRTGTAMAITSATTCMAFLCTLITPLTSIQSFGIFAAIVIFIDYLLVMTLFCTAVVIYHDRFEDRARFGCCCPCGPINPTNTEKARKALEEGGEEPVKGDFVSHFFRNKFAGFIKTPISRIAIYVLFFVWLGIAIWQAVQVEATKETEQFLDEDHPLQKSLNILNDAFPTASDDSGLKVYYAWGLDEVNRDGVNLLLEPSYFGKPIFKESFDFNKQCQTELLNVCQKLQTDPAYRDLIKQKNGIGEVYCFIEELAAYNIKGNLNDCDYVRSGAWRQDDWQIDPADLGLIMTGFLQSKSCFDDDRRETIVARYTNELGWDGSKMKYAGISAESNVLTPFSMDAESVARAEYNQFISIAEELNQGVIAEYCAGSVVMTDLDTKFPFMNNQSIYVKSALQSSILGVAIAFVVLLASTRVLHIAVFASLTITSVLVSVVGTMVMLGWTLGSIESILIGITAGFSVDYVVHLAHAYEIAEGDTYERITEAFADLGISVFNGMITSVAASIPLFFCQLQFFAKFGTFLCLTIAFSWLFANFTFMSVLATFKIPIKSGGCRL